MEPARLLVLLTSFDGQSLMRSTEEWVGFFEGKVRITDAMVRQSEVVFVLEFPTSPSDYWDYIGRDEAKAGETEKVRISQSGNDVSLRGLGIERVGTGEQWSTKGEDCYRLHFAASSSASDTGDTLELELTWGTGSELQVLAKAASASTPDSRPLPTPTEVQWGGVRVRALNSADHWNDFDAVVVPVNDHGSPGSRARVIGSAFGAIGLDARAIGRTIATAARAEGERGSPTIAPERPLWVSLDAGQIKQVSDSGWRLRALIAATAEELDPTGLPSRSVATVDSCARSASGIVQIAAANGVKRLVLPVLGVGNNHIDATLAIPAFLISLRTALRSVAVSGLVEVCLLDDSGAVLSILGDMTMSGPSACIASDRWTAVDTLGYGPYALAIARFLQHPSSHPPLAIGIQAPWGGGKTSLMRMIQYQIDPPAVPTDPATRAETVARATDSGDQPTLSVKQAVSDVKQWVDGARELPRPELSHAERLTIWFNAWQYESTNQIWAGLADALIHQTSQRLTAIDRERFWLRLNLERIDPDVVRRRVHERVLTLFARILSNTWSIVGAAVALAGSIVIAALAHQARFTAVGPCLIAAASALAAHAARRRVSNEPASIALADVVRVPNYDSELGFVHHVARDVERVIACVPDRCKPIVVFIDDLDRCMPRKVAEVIEAINLFMAGEINDCVFVLGMDAEVVAAALQAAHKETSEQLPPEARAPMGWRFMDKFIQLPFVIPPADEDDLARYTTALLAVTTATPKLDDGLRSDLQKVYEVSTNGRSAAIEARSVVAGSQLTLAEQELAIAETQARVITREIELQVDAFRDDDEQVQSLLRDAIQNFISSNPRELKRFINAFRFQYFLWWAERARNGAQSISLVQLQRWVIFSMKWPEVVRWHRRGSSRHHGAGAGPGLVKSRLEIIEEAARVNGVTTAAEWCNGVMTALNTDPQRAPWLLDDELFDFFRSGADEDRLSLGVGAGLW